MGYNDINVLINDANWAWPQATKQIFQSRGVELLLAKGSGEALDIIEKRRVHTAILDMDNEPLGGLGVIKMIHGRFPLLPCILLSSTIERRVLMAALELDVFSVISKPVNMELLQRQLHKLFIKKYNCEIFA